MCFGSRKDHTRAAAARPSGSGSTGCGLLILSFWARKLCQKYSLIPEVSEVQFGPEFFQMYSLVPEVFRKTEFSTVRTETPSTQFSHLFWLNYSSYNGQIRWSFHHLFW
ncbi:hypothetical protein K7X08_007106 [Anisodus acutangulus]|uniref:Uncharacterized protein n=1 Tax=Anisodus acutangulus TaxID=402998 RepID=A0A9Q1LF09_9SOLA|nr:hypothetical protein K7X08_007106 [Anisodus acutangulus]